MTSSEDYKKRDLYGLLFKSIDKLLEEKENVIPERERLRIYINKDWEFALKEFAEHKARCREKYGTDEGIQMIYAHFFSEEKRAKKMRLEAEGKLTVEEKNGNESTI